MLEFYLLKNGWNVWNLETVITLLRNNFPAKESSQFLCTVIHLPDTLFYLVSLYIYNYIIYEVNISIISCCSVKMDWLEKEVVDDPPPLLFTCLPQRRSFCANFYFSIYFPTVFWVVPDHKKYIPFLWIKQAPTRKFLIIFHCCIEGIL